MKELRKIMVVDSSEEDRAELHRIWEDGNEYVLVEAENSAQAMEVLRRQKDIDLIFLDMTSVETNGLHFLREVKRGECSHIPVMVGVNQGQDAQVERALLSGAEDFIQKPYNEDVLKKRANIVINRDLQGRDPLTKVYTAVTFYNRTKQMLLKFPEIPYAVIWFNIKGFTLINGFYGNEVGDAILLEFAQILEESIGDHGTYGRIISDNFVVCIPNAKGGEAVNLYKYVESRLDKLRRKYHFNMECGIYRVEDLQTPVSVMCDRAKFSLMDIRANIDGRYAYYNDDSARRYREKQRIIADMERALKESQYFIMYQPIYDTNTERPVGAEALVRWRHPEMGIICPDTFIPLFEKNGFIHRLDLYVWEEVCRFLAGVRDKGYTPLPISVNVSRIDLYNSVIVAAVEDILRKYDLPKELLRLEITETAYTEKPQEILNLVSDLRKSGFAMLMDDFGSGYSSLNMLKEMPIDMLKIDKQFMVELATSRRAGNILISIIRMAKLLNISTIAEGVETERQLEFLRNAGCDKIQGYYFAKPMQTDEFERLLAEETKKPERHEVLYKKGVLIVDDVKILRKALIGALGDTYQYFEAENGKEALEVLRESVTKIRIVLADIYMPEMDGFKLLAELRSNPIYSHIPVMVITASEERDDEVKALEMGAMDVITKPYDASIVSRRVRNVLELSEMDWLQMEMRLMNEGEPKPENED